MKFVTLSPGCAWVIDRLIAKAGLMGRAKAGKLRLLAQDQGWLDKDAPLPVNEVIERLTRK